MPEIPEKILALVESREKYRKKGHYKESDSLRKQILSLGFSVEDTPRGPFVWSEVRQ
jgi:cysteinyl-tRNA synthetase